MPAKTMNVLSLFAGIQIGGLDLGLERAGMTVVGQVEIDPFCQRVLAKHWPEVPRHDDVRTTVDWWRSAVRPAVDVVAGGFPCQPVSVAGRGLAQADERWLWPAFAEVIRNLRPRFAIMENVPGLLGRGAGDVLGDLAALGYDAEWDCVPAAAVGAPHVRDRWFCVAYAAGQGSQDWAATSCGESGAALRVEPERLGGEVADTESDGRQPRRPGHTPEGSPRRESDRGGLGTDVADPNRFAAGWPPVPRPERHHWAVEPDVGRVAHGIPGRVDRLRGLGNAVVPQVAEYVGRLVMAGAA